MRRSFGVSLGLTLVVAMCVSGVAALGARSASAEDNPMKAWMKANMGATRASNDFPGLVKAFDKVAASVPDPSWSEWAPISKQGAVAAKAENMKGVKESCNACHVKYKDLYKAKYASRAWPL